MSIFVMSANMKEKFPLLLSQWVRVNCIALIKYQGVDKHLVGQFHIA